jgi:flagellar L-ring protein precursor FlgH
MITRRVLAIAAIGVLLVTISFRASAESLYREDAYSALTSDEKAHRVGDLLTIKVYEQSSATTSTDTTTQRTNGVNGSISILPTGRQIGGSLAQGGTFDGGGTTQRANKLLATLSVNVKDVLPNGDLIVAGEQTLTVNNEQHKVNLTGRVRPQDISSDNIVLSTRLADAHIDYLGEGDLSDRQKRGWWRQLVDWLGL